MMVNAYVINGLGIGCHQETAHAYRKAGADAEIVHIRQLLSGEKKLSDSQILNFSGGFLHGDILGAGMCAANELEHAAITENGQLKKMKDMLIDYARKGNIIYGQCNGFQLLVKTGLLPGIGGDYSKQTVTLTHNDCGSYRVDFVLHRIETHHFAFEGIENNYLRLWCRHGEGKMQFHSEYGSMPKEKGEENRKKVNDRHVLLRYADPITGEPTEKFPANPNGSIDGIAGLMDPTGNIFGHMAHPEVSIYASRDPRFFAFKDKMRREHFKAEDFTDEVMEDEGLRVFRNIVKRFR